MKRRPAVSNRSLLLGAVLIPFNVYWVMTVEGIWHTGHPSVMALPWGVVFNVIVLLAANVVLKRYLPGWALTQAEMVTVYAMVGVAVMLAAHDTLQLGVPDLSHGWWFATEANRWEVLFHKDLPRFATVSDLRVLEDFYDGHSTLYTKERLLAWSGPVLWWCAVVLAVGLVMVGINVLLRKQWTEREKLGFPLIQLPLAMTAEGGNPRFFSDRMLWLGIAIGAGLDLWNGLHYFWPQVPIIDVRHNGTHYLEAQRWGLPWSAIGRTGIPLYPFCIALGFLIPLDLCFSIWFNFVFRKLQQVAVAAFPIHMMPQAPYLDAQSFGAWFVLFGYALWMGRRHFADLGREVLSGRVSDEKSDADPMSDRAAVLAVLGGLAFLTYFCLRLGMTLPAIIPFLGFIFLIHTAITRMRAELGPPAHEMAGNMNAICLEVMVAGTRALGARNLAKYPLFYWISGRGYRTTPMPGQLEAFKMAEASGAEPNRLAAGMVMAFALGGLASYWSAIHLTYQHGTTPLINHNGGPWNQLASWLNYAQPPNWQGIVFIGVGGLWTALLSWMRLNFVWWPLHPAGYALGMLFGVDYFWSCLLIAWLIKWAILHWAGHKTYQRFMPVVYGVIIGEYTVGAFWSAMSVILQRPMYDFSPG